MKNENSNVDPDRHWRTNIPEVVLAPFKDDATLRSTIEGLLPGRRVLVTKCKERQVEFLQGEFSGKIEHADPVSGTMIVSDTDARPEVIGSVAVLSAGSSDYFVAEEAGISAEFLGMEAHRFYDCGVAGFHRVDEAMEVIEGNNVDAIIVVAGMEGALPSVIAGRVKQPIIAVPTSVGYGTSFEGITALLSMLNSCTPGISVVNIDNGFGAAACVFKWLKYVRR